MLKKSTPNRYGTVAITIHWLTALAVLGMLVSGLSAGNTSDAGTELILLRGHAIMGSLVGVLTVFRIVWWIFFDRYPADKSGLSRGQSIASHLVHYGIYLVILVMVSSGIATLVFTGATFQLFGAAPLPLPDFQLAPPFTLHGILSRILLVFLAGHIGAALWHQFGKRDNLLARMGIGR